MFENSLLWLHMTALVTKLEYYGRLMSMRPSSVGLLCSIFVRRFLSRQALDRRCGFRLKQCVPTRSSIKSCRRSSRFRIRETHPDGEAANPEKCAARRMKVGGANSTSAWSGVNPRALGEQAYAATAAKISSDRSDRAGGAACCTDRRLLGRRLGCLRSAGFDRDLPQRSQSAARID